MLVVVRVGDGAVDGGVPGRRSGVEMVGRARAPQGGKGRVIRWRCDFCEGWE